MHHFFITEWTSLTYQCLPIMCSPCLFLHFSVYSKICLILVYYTAWSGNIPEHRAHPHHGRSMKSHTACSIYTSCFTRFHSHSLHSTSSDDHSLLSHRTDDCAVCICEKACKEMWLSDTRNNQKILIVQSLCDRCPLAQIWKQMPMPSNSDYLKIF